MFSKDNPIRQSPLFEVMLLLLALLASMLVLTLVTTGLAPIIGLGDLKVLLEDLENNLTADVVSGLRILQLVGQICLFLLPVLLFFTFANAKKPFHYLFLDKIPAVKNFLLGIALMIVAMPFVQFIFWLNKQIPLPDFLASSEDNTNSLTEAMLSTTDTPTFLLNMLIIALIPALGEEFLFRGLIQRIFGKISKNPHRAIWLTAAWFSFMHIQFAGFFPRLFLGAMLGYMLYWSGTLWVPIVAHFFYNGVQVIAMYLHQKGSIATDIENIEQFPIALTIISAILLLGLGRYMFNSNQENRQLYEERMAKGLQ